MARGRPLSPEGRAILAALTPRHVGMTAAEIARDLQLSNHAAARHLSRMAKRGEVEVAGTRAVEGCDKPVMVYRAVSVDLQPAGTIFESLNRAIALRRRIREAG